MSLINGLSSKPSTKIQPSSLYKDFWKDTMLLFFLMEQQDQEKLIRIILSNIMNYIV